MDKQITVKDVIKNAYTDITLTVKEIINVAQPLTQLASEKMPVILSFKISKLLKEVNEITEIFYKKRTEILESYGTLNKKENKFEFKDKKEAEATTAINVELDNKITLKILQVHISELGDLKIEPRIFASLNWYFLE